MPSTSPPQYGVGEGVNLKPWERYVVIGAGKTGLDALLFLLDQNVDSDRIFWIVSNDCCYNRDMTEMENSYKVFALQFDAILNSDSVDEMYENSERVGLFIIIDKSINPKNVCSDCLSKGDEETFLDQEHHKKWKN